MKEFENENGEVVHDQDAANFMNITPKLINMFFNCWDERDFKLNSDSTFQINFICEAEVKRLVDQNDLSMSSEAFDCMTLELTNLYNTCVDSGIFPQKWGI